VENKVKTGRRRGRPPLSEKIDREKAEKVSVRPATPQPVQPAASTAQSPVKQVVVVPDNDLKLPMLNIEKTLTLQVCFVYII